MIIAAGFNLKKDDYAFIKKMIESVVGQTPLIKDVWSYNVKVGPEDILVMPGIEKKDNRLNQ